MYGHPGFFSGAGVGLGGGGGGGLSGVNFFWDLLFVLKGISAVVRMEIIRFSEAGRQHYNVI